MTLHDVSDLAAHWQKHPPAHMAIRRLERIVCAAAHIEVHEPSPALPPGAECVDEDAVRATVAMMNARP